MTNEEKIELVQKLQRETTSNEEKIAIIQQLQSANKSVEEPKKKGFFQRIKDAVNEANERERALEAADPIAYRQMKAMERIARNTNNTANNAELVRLQGLQQAQNGMMKAAIMTGNNQLMHQAMTYGL